MANLLQTKLAVPTTRPSLVVRDRLLRQLDAVRHNRLVLVSAPAGFGKTTLIAAYAAQAAALSNIALAWLSLGEEDNDPARFLAYLLAALSAAGTDISSEETAVSSMPPEQMMTEVVNDLTTVLAAQPDHHFIFVLDDYHLIHNRAIHETITFLLEHMPAQMHLILVTRADPPLPLPRWRARSQLVELRQQDLCFTPEEAADFLNQIMALPLSADDVQILNSRTEGWIAGLQMAAISLQGRANMADFVQSFGGSHRYILDYLMEEVLSRQPDDVTQFLLQTAVLNRLTAPLCDAVLAISEWRLEDDQSPIPNLQSQKILEHLETTNLFLVSLDDERRWFRYHRLFVDLLRQRLAQTQSELIPILHKRAVTWFEANGYLEEAISHALMAKDTGQAADLIAQMAEPMLMRSELVTVKQWLAALPESELVKRPSLSFYYAWILIMEGHVQDEVEMALHHVDVEGAPGELALVRSLTAILRGDGTTAIELAQQALNQLKPERSFMRGVGTWILGLSFLFRGELEQGVQTLEKAVQLSQQVGNMTIAAASLGRLANQAWRAGDLSRAKRIYEQALVLGTDEMERPLPISGEAHIGLARLYFEWNELDKALQHAETGLALTEGWRELSAMFGNVWLARIRQAQDQPTAANDALERAWHIARQTKGTQFDDMAVAMTEASLRILQGDLEAVEVWCVARHLPRDIDVGALERREDIIEGHLRKYEFIILARLRLVQKRPDEALALLPRLLANAQRLQRRELQIESLILTALAFQQKNELAKADSHLQEALTLAEPGGFIRLFVEAGPGVAALLARQPATNGKRRTYLNKLLAAGGQELPDAQAPIAFPPSPLIEPLSDRELEVLRLIANGLSNREIAQELILSLPTIKWHTSNIYGKLGVGNRTTAVARARELHILT